MCVFQLSFNCLTTVLQLSFNYLSTAWCATEGRPSRISINLKGEGENKQVFESNSKRDLGSDYKSWRKKSKGRDVVHLLFEKYVGFDSLEYTMSSSHDPLPVNQDSSTPMTNLASLRMNQSEGNLPWPFSRHGWISSDDSFRKRRVIVVTVVSTFCSGVHLFIKSLLLLSTTQ